MNFSDTELHKRQSHLLMLFMLAEAGGDQNEQEGAFILQVGERLGLKKKVIIAIDKKPQNLTFILPKTDKERNAILYDLLFLMKFDRVVDQNEIQLIHEVAFRMGFRPTMTQEMIEVMKVHIGKAVPKNALLDIIKKHLN
jgi:spore coat protein CotH